METKTGKIVLTVDVAYDDSSAPEYEITCETDGGLNPADVYYAMAVYCHWVSERLRGDCTPEDVHGRIGTMLQRIGSNVDLLMNLDQLDADAN